jgi:hypothetical protein
MPGLIYNGVFFDDISDPRNFDIEHTYFRNSEIYPVFYPSITAYSSNTGSYDTCSTTIGPILLEDIKNIKPLKTINNQKETLYVYSVDDTCTFFTSITSSPKTVISKVPSNKIVNDISMILTNRGNNGDNFIIDEPPTCLGYVLTAERVASGGLINTGTALLTQESDTTTYTTTTALAQESNDFILI